MNYSIASSLMHHIAHAGNFKVGRAPPSVQRWLESLELPADLLSLLRSSWPLKDADFLPVLIFGSKKIQEQEWIEAFVEHRFLPVGSGPNGDFFAIDVSVDACPVGYVSHEEYDLQSDPRPLFQPAARSVESFLFRIAEGRFFPCDYFEATDFNQFLRDEAEHEPFPPYRRVTPKSRRRR